MIYNIIVQFLFYYQSHIFHFNFKISQSDQVDNKEIINQNNASQQESSSQTSQTTSDESDSLKELYNTEKFRNMIFRDNKCIKIKQNFMTCSSKKIDFDIKQCYIKSQFNGRHFHSECGNLFDTPQLYRCFQKDYAQVLNYIVKFVDQTPKILYEIKELNPNCAEENYNRVCYYKNDSLIFSTGNDLYYIQFDLKDNTENKDNTNENQKQNIKYQKQLIYQGNDNDFMVFSYQGDVVAFDINNQTLYKVNINNNVLRNGNNNTTNIAKLDKISETESIYLIMSNMDEPTPLIFIYDFKTKKHIEKQQNFFQDSFFDYLQINEKCELELDDESQALVNKMFMDKNIDKI